jgi:hypothetical protein
MVEIKEYYASKNCSLIPVIELIINKNSNDLQNIISYLISLCEIYVKKQDFFNIPLKFV